MFGKAALLQKIAFFSLTPSPPAPPANQMTLEALKKRFPDYKIDTHYILPLLKKKPFAIACSAAVAAGTYAPDLVTGRKKLKYAVFRTPWVFHWIKRQAATLVHQSNYSFSFQMQSLFDASVPGVPHFVYTDHTHLENLNFEGFPTSGLYSREWINCERTIYENATRVFTRSSNVSASLETQYACHPEKIACVYAGSNAAVPTSASTNSPRYQKKNILFAGVDWERKGGPTLLAAFRMVLKRHPDATLTIVGCSPDPENTPRCNVVGRVPLDQMPQYYDDASLFCMPTRVEPFGIVFVEAMWQSLPIVATGVGAVPDMVSEGVNGHLVQPGDAEGLATRLSALLDRPDQIEAFGAASYRLAKKRYDWSLVGGKMRASIEAALSHD